VAATADGMLASIEATSSLARDTVQKDTGSAGPELPEKILFPF
jgi:hypothetical protein